MNNIEYNPFDGLELSPQDSVDVYKKKSQEGKSNENPFDELTFDEGFWKNAFRTALQVPQGIAEATKYGIGTGLFQMLALGESDLGVEEWHKLRELAEQEGIPFDEEAYEQGRQEMLGSIPTVSNIASKIESEYGVPLEPRTGLQKALRLGSMAGKFQPGAASQKATAAVAAPAAAVGLEAAGVPEQFAELGALGVGAIAGGKAPAIDVSLTKTKPSGLPARQFEKTTSPKEVPRSKLETINEKLESDFKKISDDIIKESPVGETAEALKNDPTFKQESRELLNQAQEIADTIPSVIESKSLKKEITDLSKKNVKGFALGEYDKNYLKFMNEASKDIKSKNISMSKLVEQYRKNNKSLGEYFEPGSSKALNRAKRDALLDQNRAIATVLEKSAPELSTVFKEGNGRWTKIMDAEAVDNFIGDMFDGKVNFKKMHDFFDKEGYAFKFKRALGDEGYKKFEGLMKDMVSSEVPYKMLKVAKTKGWGDLAETAGAFIIHPTLGKAKIGIQAAKQTYKSIMNAMLDKPQIAVTWKRAVDDLKKGNFEAATKGFEALKEEVEVLPREEAPKAKAAGETFEVKGEKKAKPKAIEAPKKQIEHKAPEKTREVELEEEGRAFRDSFMEKKDLGSSERLDKMGKKAAENLEEKRKKTLKKFNEKVKPKKEKPVEKKKTKIDVLQEDLKEIQESIGNTKNLLKNASSKEYENVWKKQLKSLEKEEIDFKKALKNEKTKKTKAEKPKPAKSLTEEKVEEVKRQDISKKGLKEQKHYLIEELDKAIEKAPEGYEEFQKDKKVFTKTGDIKKRAEKYELLTFDVPGDGQFKIRNHKGALQQFRDSVEKRWPDKAMRKPKFG